MRWFTVIFIAMFSTSVAQITRYSLQYQPDPNRFITSNGDDIANYIERKYNLNSVDREISSKSNDGVVSERLTDVGTTFYSGAMSLGTPGQCFTMMFDTGSSTIWVPGESCQSAACQNHKKFLCSASRTCHATSQQKSIVYGFGNISGTVHNDRFCFGCSGEVKCNDNQYFLATTKEPSPVFVRSKFDGLVGMSFQTAIRKNLPFRELVNSGKCQAPVFAFWLNPNKRDVDGGEMTLCGIDRDHYVGQLFYVPLTSQRRWLIEVGSLKVSTTEIATKFQALVDTGTSVILGPNSDIDSLRTAIGAKRNATNGHWFVDCNAINRLPTITFTISGRPLQLTPDQYIVRARHNVCASVFQGVKAVPSKRWWILGDAFISRYYTVFDQGNARIGFAPAR